MASIFYKNKTFSFCPMENLSKYKKILISVSYQITSAVKEKKFFLYSNTLIFKKVDR